MPGRSQARSVRSIAACLSLVIIASCGGARPIFGYAGRGVVTIYDGDALFGSLAGSSYFGYDAEPGKHLFACNSDPPGMDFMRGG